MVFQPKIIEKQEITDNLNLLNLMFPGDSPIPGYAKYGIDSRTKIWLITAKFEMDFFEDCPSSSAKKGPKEELFGLKSHVVFIIKNDNKTFKYTFANSQPNNTIGKTISNGLRDHSNIAKIVLITKYTWRHINDPIENIIERDINILVFDIPPDIQQIVERRLKKLFLTI